MDRAEEGMGDGRGDGRDWMKNEDSERQYARQGESHKDFTAIRSCCWLILHDAVSAPLTDSSRGSADHSPPPPPVLPPPLPAYTCIKTPSYYLRPPDRVEES